MGEGGVGVIISRDFKSFLLIPLTPALSRRGEREFPN